MLHRSAVRDVTRMESHPVRNRSKRRPILGLKEEEARDIVLLFAQIRHVFIEKEVHGFGLLNVGMFALRAASVFSTKRPNCPGQ